MISRGVNAAFLKWIDLLEDGRKLKKVSASRMNLKALLAVLLFSRLSFALCAFLRCPEGTLLSSPLSFLPRSLLSN